LSVKEGNSTSISALVHVDNNLNLDKDAFQFLVEEIQEDIEELPEEVLNYREWLRTICQDLEAPVGMWEVANMKELRQTYTQIKRSDRERRGQYHANYVV
jgi:hypothetical protein